MVMVAAIVDLVLFLIWNWLQETEVEKIIFLKKKNKEFEKRDVLKHVRGRNPMFGVSCSNMGVQILSPVH